MKKGTDPAFLVFRFSAMGDVAMVASVLREVVEQQPNLKVVMVSRDLFKPFFTDIPGVHFHPFYPDGEHKGTMGIFRLFRELQQYHPLAVADLHDNLRSKMLSTLFLLKGTKVQRLDKGRREKKALTRPRNKIKRPLKPTAERYADVFRSLGYPVLLRNTLVSRALPYPQSVAGLLSAAGMKVGVAPFAQHVAKVYPMERMEEVLAYLDRQGHTVFIFGGQTNERRIAEGWQSRFTNVYNLIGRFTLEEELAIISHLTVMLSMDSANMHIASLVGVRVLSIWGGTHPFAGFLGYGQQLDDCIQVEHPARPSSVYGDKPCLCDGVDSMQLIAPEMVIDKFKQIGL